MGGGARSRLPGDARASRDLMLQLTRHTLKKRVPLTISRGTITHSNVFWLQWEEEGVTGWGEMVPFSIDDRPQTVEVLEAAFATQRGWLEQTSAWERAAIERRLWEVGAPSALIAAVNLALYDWLGKRLGQPVWRLLGLRAETSPLTSVTIGIAPPEAAAHRVHQWREVGDVRAFKVKLGSPAGADADRAMFTAVKAVLPPGARVSVDANGGWSLETALAMAPWLAAQGVDHLEQPLARGREAELPALHAQGALPLMVDESCRTSTELARIVGSVDGINIKLMKCGGLDGALRLIATARAHGLKILVGCYGNTALANTAGAQLGGLVDYLDLDSHLNLEDDPFRGATLHEGRLQLSASPGLGVTYEHTR
jgi:L-alanine-DL-glutamate epimerase-like enolase superfamily enzyme